MTPQTLTMTVFEADGSEATSDITEFAEMLLNLGKAHPRRNTASATSPLLTLTLDGTWAWGDDVGSDDVALQYIADGLYHTIVEAITTASAAPSSE